MDQQFSLSWNNFHGNLTKGFAGLLGNGEFVDVTLAVDGHLLQAHKVILSICSPYFKKMFQTNPCQHPIVVLRDVTHKAMRDLLQFMYHGEVSVKREDLTSFIGTAEVLQIKGLTNKECEEDIERDHDSIITQNKPEEETSTPEPPESPKLINNDSLPNTELELIKQREFIEKLQRLSNLKRKSEEFLHRNYFSDILPEKQQKIREKHSFGKLNNHMSQSCDYENVKSFYNENVEVSSSINLHKNSNINKDTDTCKEQTERVELKTECDDIIVTDPAVCMTPKKNDGRESQDSSVVEYPSPQENCPSLNALFMDLKNLVNGKSNNLLRVSGTDEIQRPVTEHRLTTIPQKEDGKKKYPQRSCRLCWKIGKRRDTRFMCSTCEIPFCKSPCFEIHYSDALKMSQMQDFYAT